ncbi:MAG TPA: SusC/RagA family TonB-linked outer membrane protein, partial [Chitinophagaceae bacterium]
MIKLDQHPLRRFPKIAGLLTGCILTLLVASPVNGQPSPAKSQKLFLGFHNTSVLTAFNKIESTSDIRFSYNRDDINTGKKITLPPKERTVSELLSEVGAQAGLAFSYADDLVLVKPDRLRKPAAKKIIHDDLTVTGKVTSSLGEPIPGVTIKVSGQNIGTVTDGNGAFSLSVPDTAVLIVSYIGYQTKEVPVNGQSVLNIILEPSSSGLSEVVVIGYGTQKKRDLTGSIAVIKGDDIAKMPSSNPIASLQGKVAGLTIVNSGQAGASPTVRIRGVNSTNNADPLYVVDGILQTNIDYLNPADIETIEVLKDPSSIAIYGLQGGNGVIIITTKRAKKGETIVNFQSNIGIQQVNNKIKLADAEGFKKLYSAQLANLNAAPFDYTNYTGNTDWQNQVLRAAVTSNNTLSVSSSGDKTTTYLNLGYSNQQGVEKYDAYQKYIARLNEEIQVSKSIRVGADVTGYYWKQNPPAGATVQEALWAAPIVPVKAGQGLYYAMPSFQRAQVQNPTALIDGNNGNAL